MPRFRFSLEGLLRYNTAQENQAASLLVGARLEEARQQERLAEYSQELAAHSQALPPSLEVGGSQYLDLYRQGLQQAVARQEVVLSRTKEVTEKQRVAFVEARKQRQVVEKLREQQWVAFQKEEERKAYREMDELVTIRPEKGGE